MKNFFSKIKNGIGKVLVNIKKVFVNLKDKIKNVFNRIGNKNVENQEISEINYEPIISNENTNSISNERQTVVRDTIIPMNSDTKFRTTGHDTFVAPIVMNKNQNNNVQNIEKDSGISQDNVSYSDEVDNTINTENLERIVSIEIKESIGIVEFETTTGKKYQKNIDDILSEKKNLYKDWNINKKCNNLAKNKIQALRLKRKLNPVVISTLNNEEDIDTYIKCVKDTEKIWFNLEHDLINSKLKGKNARLMQRVGKHEEKIGAKVKRKENLIERMLKKIKAKNKVPEEMAEELEEIEKDNNELNGIEEEIVEDINLVEDKKSRKEERLAKKEEELAKKEKEKSANREFKVRYEAYAAVLKKIYGKKPKKNLDEIMNSIIDRDLYNLTDKDDWVKAIATFNIGHRLAMLNRKVAKKYLHSAYNQLNKEQLLAKNDDAFKYLEDTLLNLQEIYNQEKNFDRAISLNDKYMKIVEREKKEKTNPMISDSEKKGLSIKVIDLIIDFRSKYVAGQKEKMKILYNSGKKFEAEELYRKILNESGIKLSDEEYDLSIKGNCIENGEYILVKDGINFRNSILGSEQYLSRKKQLVEQLDVKTKANETKIEVKSTELEQPTTDSTNVVEKQVKEDNKIIETKTETAAVQETVSTKLETLQDETKDDTRKSTSKTVEQKTKNKGIIAIGKIAIENLLRERAEKEKERKIREEQKRKEEEEHRKADELQKKLEEERKAENAEFKSKYNTYNILVKGLLGEGAKKDLKEIKEDVVHNDIYNMTSSDEFIKGTSTFRVGHRMAMLNNKKKEAERLLKSAASILDNEKVLINNENAFESLESAYLDLANLYMNQGDYKNADLQIMNYMKTMQKQKTIRYDPKIIEARNQNLKLIEVNHWIEYEAKLTKGKKASIKLLSKAGNKSKAEELYKVLLNDAKINLSQEEYELSKKTGCIENGQYMIICKDRTYCEEITGTEYLWKLKNHLFQQVTKEIKEKHNAEFEKEQK